MMMEMIQEVLREVGVSHWSISDQQVSAAELFFIRRALDMRRMKNTRKYIVTVYHDFEKDGTPMRGSSSVTILPAQSREEVKKAVEDTWFAASFVENPFYELPEKQTCAPMTMESGLSSLSVEEAAMKLSDALFSADKGGKAFLNSAEIFVEKTTRHLLMSTGTDVCYTRYGAKGEFVAQCREPEDVEMHHIFEYDTLACDALRKEAETALRQVEDRAAAEKNLPTGTYDLILSDRQVETILSYFVERSNASMIYPGYSTWQVGSNVQERIEDGERLQLTLHATVPYSGEGVPMRDRRLIEDGKLCVIHGGVRLSAYLGVPATGDYQAFTCENGTVDLEEMKEKPYLYPVSFSDFQMDSMSGHFGGEIRLAYYFDGKETRIVTGGSINGSIHDCCGRLVFSRERYDSESYHGPFAVRMPGVKVAGTV